MAMYSVAYGVEKVFPGITICGTDQSVSAGAGFVILVSEEMNKGGTFETITYGIQMEGGLFKSTDFQ